MGRTNCVNRFGVIGLLFAGFLFLERPAVGADNPARLVEKLASRSYAERQSAESKLLALGLNAISSVRLGTQSSDAEVAGRCELLVKKIRRKRDKRSSGVESTYRVLPASDSNKSLVRRRKQGACSPIWWTTIAGQFWRKRRRWTPPGHRAYTDRNLLAFNTNTSRRHPPKLC